MSILHRRRQVKNRHLDRLASGERCSAPHEYARASSKDASTAEAAAPASAPAVRTRRKAKAKAKAKRKARA